MRGFANMPIRGKLTLVILITSLAVVLLACGALAVQEVLTYRSALAREMTVMADVLGRNSRSAITFGNDEKNGADTLSALAADPHIIAACLFGGQKRFAEYQRKDTPIKFPDSPPEQGHEFVEGTLVVAQPITQENKRIGTIYLVADLQGVNERLKSYGVIASVVVVLAFAVTFALSFVLQRIISEPIVQLTQTARRIAEQKDYSVRARKQGGDEIGLLTDAFNQMLDEIAAAQSALQQANQSLQSHAVQIMESVGVLSGSSSDILTLSTQLATAATETASAVSQTSTTVEQVKHNALLASQRIVRVSEGAQKVARISESGKKSTEQTAEGMQRIREQMQSIAQSMVRLNEQTQAIGQVIATVDDLARQSNLLAVNAAIEAAKAGEQGKGFAVVAAEVRTMAEQSRQATDQVRKILSDIQKAAGTAAIATEQGAKAVEAGVKQSGEAGESIVTLSANIGEATDAAKQVVAISQQQLTGMDQVAQAIGSIRELSAQNAESARKLQSAARNLSDLGKTLSSLVARYKS